MGKEETPWIKACGDPWWIELIGGKGEKSGECLDGKEQGRRVTFDPSNARNENEGGCWRKSRNFFGKRRSAMIFSNLERMLEEAEEVLDPPRVQLKEASPREGGRHCRISEWVRGAEEGKEVERANAEDEISEIVCDQRSIQSPPESSEQPSSAHSHDTRGDQQACGLV